ncbi:MAG TPA: molybdopterin-dependent oxidoreductase [Polyangiaceae bacterium]|nr:molybdopterin-dependent oxidoreductase [Polyangiaceae bacterium]
MSEAVTTRYQVCELCETGCGLAVDVQGERLVGVRGNEQDVFSRGFICPKGLALPELEHDPDRLKSPVRRDASGAFQRISWDEALSTTAERLKSIQRRFGRDSVAVYMGTPVVHKYGALLMRGALLGALKTKNSTSAGSQDTSTRFAASYFLYGSAFSTPIPDLDRTEYFLCIGANPLVSNGSLLTAPNMRARLRALRERGAKLIVVDPRRTETAELASEHVAVLPGGDAALLLGMIQVLIERGQTDTAWIERHTRGFEALARHLRSFTPERAAQLSGVSADTIRRLALEFAQASSSVAYARVGVCNNAFGTLASYAVDVLNIVAGRLGAAGGALFAKPAIDLPRLARMVGADGYARWHSRVRRLPETAGDIPASTLAEEMETAGEGQVRALVTFAGNPVLSTPNGGRLARAVSKLEFMVSIDPYINETTRFADVILPPCGALSEEHVDLFFANVAARNVIRWTKPAIARGADERTDWEILLDLSYRLGGGPAGMAPVDWVARQARKMGFQFTPASIADLAIRMGPYGDRFLPGHKGLNGAKVRASEHGVDLGPLEPGIEHRIFHKHGRIELSPPALLAAITELSSTSERARTDELLLIGRRDIRSNNSWMHNVTKLVAGRDRCVLLVHPSDAARIGIADGESATLQSRVHRGEVRVQITDEMRPGVVSLPHGWGHAEIAAWQRVAGAHPGVSANDWTDDQHVESVVGQSILNGVPVTLSRTGTFASPSA